MAPVWKGHIPCGDRILDKHIILLDTLDEKRDRMLFIPYKRVVKAASGNGRLPSLRVRSWLMSGPGHMDGFGYLRGSCGL